MKESALMLLGVADQFCDVVVGREEGVCEDFGAGEGEVGDACCAEGDLLEVRC